MTSSPRKGNKSPKIFIRFREGHLYRLQSGVLVVIYDTYRPAEHENRQGMGIVVQGTKDKPVGTQLYPISPYEVVGEEYPLTDEDKEGLFNRGVEIGAAEANEKTEA